MALKTLSSNGCFLEGTHPLKMSFSSVTTILQWDSIPGCTLVDTGVQSFPIQYHNRPLFRIEIAVKLIDKDLHDLCVSVADNQCEGVAPCRTDSPYHITTGMTVEAWNNRDGTSFHPDTVGGWVCPEGAFILKPKIYIWIVRQFPNLFFEGFLLLWITLLVAWAWTFLHQVLLVQFATEGGIANCYGVFFNSL